MELLTAERTQTLQDWDLVQIINGKEIKMPSPKAKHQQTVAELFFLIRQYLLSNNFGKVLLAPLDVIFEENVDRVQPDLIFILNENKKIIKDFIRGVPDLVVEIISKGSFYVDTQDKRELYQHYGVKEYWIVFPEYDSIEVFTLVDGVYKIHSKGFDDEIVKSKLLDGFEVKPSQIM